MVAIIFSLFSSLRRSFRNRVVLHAEILALRHQLLVQTWRTFLENHAKDLVSSDFFVVPTVFFRMLCVFVILSHDRRRVVHFAVTEHPTSDWVAHQLVEAFPWESAPRYLLRDRDGSYDEKFSEATRWLGIKEIHTAAQSPWQNAYVERLIGSIRRECLDHVIALNESGLRRILKSYFDYYEHSRTHLSLGKDAPISRPVQPVGTGRIVAIPQVGGLHHRYERIAAQTVGFPSHSAQSSRMICVNFMTFSAIPYPKSDDSSGI